ncbi:rho guanine nucleotide exchange factor 19 [Phycodurus eques]|uniref:rho guanine nucleotide exchange factor 19 n=1 Tax=Phycodurus eques TaxID=693459 RepID=UPI002ACD6F25|nr:rho guanine nucleotide exchange factor 19 [Phycodurus eques]
MADFDSTDEANDSGGCGGDVFAQLLAYFEDLRPQRNPFKSPLPTMTTTERPRMMELNPEEPSQDYNLPFLDISSAIRSIQWKTKSPVCPSSRSTFTSELRDDLQRLNTKTSLSELIAPQYLQGLQSRLSSQQSHLQSSPGSVSASPPDRSPGSVSASPPDRHVIRMAPCTLWQDLDEVKAAGLLGGLTVRQIRLQEHVFCLKTMFELIGSEASYLRSLGIAVDHFCASKDLKRTLSQMEHHTLFSNIRHVKATSERFLMDLETRLGESVFISQLGDIVLDHCPAFRTHYVPYVTNMMYQEALINQLLQQNRGFVASLKQLEGEPLCQRQCLKSFLVLPFQRITRIKLILENILKLTEADSDAVSYLHKAKEAIHEIVSECNDGIKKMKVIEQLVSLELLLDFGKLKAVPLVISGRFLVHEGPLRLLTVESGPNPKTSLTNVHLHLFNDLLILSSKKEQHFLVEDHAKFPAYVHVAPLKTEVLGLPPESFLFHLSRNHTGQPTAMILVAHSRSDKEQWMKVLKCAD